MKTKIKKDKDVESVHTGYMQVMPNDEKEKCRLEIIRLLIENGRHKNIKEILKEAGYLIQFVEMDAKLKALKFTEELISHLK